MGLCIEVSALMVPSFAVTDQSRHFYTLNDLYYYYGTHKCMYILQGQCDDAVKIFMQVHDNN